MSGLDDLRAFLAEEAARPVAAPVRAFAAALAERVGGEAVLFYGSGLRSGAVDGVLDFYVLTAAPHRRGLRGLVERRLWPEIRFERLTAEGEVLHAKVAVMTLARFAQAAAGGLLDTTVWTRFVQPSRLVLARAPEVRAAVEAALAEAATTAARFAAALGPERGEPHAYWAALFRATYAAELRVEAPGREAHVLDAAPARWDALLPLAWRAGGVGFLRDGAVLAPRSLSPAHPRKGGDLRPLGLAPVGGPRLRGDERGGGSGVKLDRLRRAWRLRRRWGKALNAARLVKAALTAPGAAAYAAGKLARHTDVAVAVTPWRERHPLLAALPVLWRLRRRRGQADAR